MNCFIILIVLSVTYIIAGGLGFFIGMEYKKSKCLKSGCLRIDKCKESIPEELELGMKTNSEDMNLK